MSFFHSLLCIRGRIWSVHCVSRVRTFQFQQLLHFLSAIVVMLMHLHFIMNLHVQRPWNKKQPQDHLFLNIYDTFDYLQDRYEEVDIITKDGNYGWRVYEGPLLYTPPDSPGGNTTPSSISPIFPVMGYTHSDVNQKEGSASITGGYFYRSMTDPCMYGR